MVSRQKDRFGKYQNVPVGLPKGERNLINSIKFDKYGDAIVNGRVAPELTNTLKSMIKGTLQVPSSGLPTGAIFTEPPQALDTGRRSNLPTGVLGYDKLGRPIMSKSMPPRSTTPFIADGVRVTDSLLRTYITQLEKNSGVTGTTPFSSRQLGPELYNRLFGTEQASRDFVKVEGGNQGKGTPMGDAKDIQMRRIANSAIVELENIDSQNKITARASGAVGKTSSETSLLQLGPAKDDLSGKTIMLARNGKLSGQPLRPETVAQITQAAQSGAKFVVGDMPGVDSEFIKLLDKLKAPYTIYYTGNKPRIQPTTPLTGQTAAVQGPVNPMKREPTVINVRKLAANLYEGEKFTVKNLPKDAIYVGRAYSKGKYQLQGSPYGNPYRVGPDGQLDEVLSKYETWARNKLAANPKWLDPLVGKDLVDWCEPGKCHADVLKKLVKEKVGDFERAPLTGKTQLSDIEQSRARLKQLEDLKKSVGGGNLSRREAAELSRLKETIRKATTVDPTLTDMPEESASKIKVSNPEEFQKMRNRFKELDTIMKTKGLAGAELAEYERLEQSIRSVRTEATQRPDITSDKPGKVVSEKTKPETKVSIKNIGDTKAPGIYTDGKYNSQVTYNAIQTIIKMNESAKYRQVIGRQGGIRVGKVFVSVEDMQQLAKTMPTGQEVIYNKKGNPTIKPNSKAGSGGMFGILNKVIGPLSLALWFGEVVRLTKEWKRNPYSNINPNDFLK